MQKREPSTLFSIFQMTIEKAITIFEKDRDHDRNFDDTDSIKLNRLGYNTRMYWTNFWQPNVHIQQKFFEKNLIEVCIQHLYNSFCTFCVQIGQLFVAQWVFKHSEECPNRKHFPSMTAICLLSNIFQRLTLPRVIDQLGRKRCQKKRKYKD